MKDMRIAHSISALSLDFRSPRLLTVMDRAEGLDFDNNNAVVTVNARALQAGDVDHGEVMALR